MNVRRDRQVMPECRSAKCSFICAMHSQQGIAVLLFSRALLMPLTFDFYTIPAAFLFKCTSGGFNKHFFFFFALLECCSSVLYMDILYVLYVVCFMLSCMCMCVFWKCHVSFFSSAVLFDCQICSTKPIRGVCK